MTETVVARAKGRQKEMVGRVISNKMQKTVVVAVDKVKHHTLYKRTIRLTKKYYAHDDSAKLQVGDVVRIVETRPLSKLKRWRVAEVVRASRGGVIEIAEPGAGGVETVAEAAQAAAAKVAEVVAEVAQNVLNPNPLAAEPASAETKPAPRRRRTAKPKDEPQE